MNINATLLGHIIWFGAFIWLTMKYVWPPLQTAMLDRQKEIAEGLAAAERGKEKLAEADQESSKVLTEARNNASDIIGQAEKRGAQLVEEAKGSAKKEAERILENARSDIQQELNQAKELLRKEVALLAVAGAEKILQKEIDPKAHSEILAGLEKGFN